MTHLAIALDREACALANRVLDHRAAIERTKWMREAIQPAFIAVIRLGVGQLEWIKEQRMYYAPLARLGKRRFAARWVAIYPESEIVGKRVR